jgi:hypothetical protein
MTRLATGVVTVILAGCLGLPVLLAAGLFGGGTGGCATAAEPAPGGPPGGGWDLDQLAVAATIVDVGVTRGVPRWGWVVALATAMQESGLRNLPGGDRDSIGVFQQRPSQGWGTPEQLTDPAHQAGQFYAKLLTICGWDTMPLTEADQIVNDNDVYFEAYSYPKILLCMVGFIALGIIG